MFTLRRNIILVAGAVALLAGALLSSLWLRHLASEGGPAGVPKLFVMAAADNIATGTYLRPRDMTWISIDQSGQGKNFIVKDAANSGGYEGALARQNFRAGEPFVTDGLLRATDRNFLSAVLSPGSRALTLPIEAQQSSSGMVRPGDHVDIILTQNLGDAAPDPGHRVVAETLLRDIRVVAVEQALTPSQKVVNSSPIPVGEPSTPKTITLEVTEAQAKELLVAVQLGKVDLVERALVTNSTTPSLTVSDTWASNVSPALAALGSRPTTQTTLPSQPLISGRETIEVMHGNKVEIR